MAEKQVGRVEARLFARIGEGTEEVPLGIAYMPIVISQGNVRKLQVDLTQPFEVARDALEAIYALPAEDQTAPAQPVVSDAKPVPNVATALPQMPTLADVASPVGSAARKRVSVAMREKKAEETRDIADVEPSEVSDRMRKGFVSEDSFEDERP